jgi:hypothetical protein
MQQAARRQRDDSDVAGDTQGRSAATSLEPPEPGNAQPAPATFPGGSRATSNMRPCCLRPYGGCQSRVQAGRGSFSSPLPWPVRHARRYRRPVPPSNKRRSLHAGRNCAETRPEFRRHDLTSMVLSNGPSESRARGTPGRVGGPRRSTGGAKHPCPFAVGCGKGRSHRLTASGPSTSRMPVRLLSAAQAV